MTTLSDLNNIGVIDVGVSADDGTGESIRDAFIKVNANFDTVKIILAGLIQTIGSTPAPTSLSAFMDSIAPEELQSPSFVRLVRDLKLKELDSLVMNPLRYSSFDDNYRYQLSLYRQQLLDIPQQSGFPSAVLWPELPKQY